MHEKQKRERAKKRKAKREKSKPYASAGKAGALFSMTIDQEADFETFRDNPNYRQLKIGLPYFAILSPDAQLLWSSTDYSATEKMIAVLSTGAI